MQLRSFITDRPYRQFNLFWSFLPPNSVPAPLGAGVIKVHDGVVEVLEAPSGDQRVDVVHACAERLTEQIVCVSLGTRCVAIKTHVDNLSS